MICDVPCNLEYTVFLEYSYFSAIVYIKEVVGQSYETRVAQIEQIPEVIELYHTSGCDSIIVKVVAPSIERLTATLDQLSHSGTPSMSVVLGTPLARNIISNNLSDL
ncbi:MAG: Lrp/AsnC ligand binding domain-containing protein, partial [Chloroflexota bacterium]